MITVAVVLLLGIGGTCVEVWKDKDTTEVKAIQKKVTNNKKKMKQNSVVCREVV